MRRAIAKFREHLRFVLGNCSVFRPKRNFVFATFSEILECLVNNPVGFFGEKEIDISVVR